METSAAAPAAVPVAAAGAPVEAADRRGPSDPARPPGGPKSSERFRKASSNGPATSSKPG
eukprot:7295378-Lingulodinium_polyedra.AAC.1